MFSPMIIGKTTNGTDTFSPSNNTFHREPFNNKKAMELEHLQHFEAAVRRQHPKYAFSLIGDGLDPPDFQIQRGDQIVGLELTMFAPYKRRERLKFFAKIQHRMKELLENKLIFGLSGIHIELSFGDFGGKPKPIREEALQELVDAFIQLTKRPRDPLSSTNDWGSTPYPLGQEGSADEGSIHWYVAGVADAPLRGSALANSTGFELTYTQTGWTSKNEINAQLQACIDAKDKPGADELLISAGAPDREGWQIFAESDCLWYCMEEWQGLLSTPKHLKRIFLDIWGPDRVFILHNPEKSIVRETPTSPRFQ